MSSLDSAQLLELFLHFCVLSLLSVSGAIAMSSDMHRYLVNEKAWASSQMFSDSLTLAQVAPGPNILFVFLLGYKTAGWMGALATFFGIITPALTLTFFVNRWRVAHLETRFLRAVRLGLSPLAVGLTAAAGVVLSQANGTSWALVALTVVSFSFLVGSSLNPLWLIAAGAIIGALGVL